MSRRTLLNVVLAAVVAGLAAFIAYGPHRAPEPAPAPLTTLDASAVSRVVVEPRDADTVEIVRDERGWRLARPFDVPANEFRVLALLGLLAAPAHARFDAVPGELERYGLAPPRARVHLADAVIAIGDTEPLGGRRYVGYDDQVALVDDVYLGRTDARAAGFVSPALLGPAPAIVEILLPGLSVRRVDGGWRSEPALASADDVVALVDAWRAAQATTVQRYDTTLPWQDGVRVTLEDATLDFDLLRTDHEILLGRRDPGIQYRLTRRGGERLLRPASSPGDARRARSDSGTERAMNGGYDRMRVRKSVGTALASNDPHHRRLLR